MANDKISNMTAAVVGDLGATTSGLECTVDLGGAPTTKQVPLGVLADWLEASQLATLIVTNSVASATAIATPGAFGATRGAFFASTVSGAALMGFGTTNDVALMNRAGTVCLGVGPNTTLVDIPGTLAVTGVTTLQTLTVGLGGGAVPTNTGFGYQVLLANTTGLANAGFGYVALSANTTGDYNTALGYVALSANTTGAANTGVGAAALYANTTGNYNTGVGYRALTFNSAGYGLIGLGYY